jgi:NAD(P)-dependent dehydrogenase (short-subunit alcohol dehydrogenase family)
VNAVLGAFSADALAGKVSIVTGAASGQGRACALAMAAAGARVVAVDIQAAALAAVVDDIEESGGSAVAVGADLSAPSCGTEVVDAAIGRFGRLDALLNCAAIAGTTGGLMGTVETTPVEAWDRAFATNIRSMYLMSQAAVPHLRAAGGGSIVNWSSGAAFQGMSPGSTAYAATKGAVVSLTNAMAVTLGADRIRVNTIVPGLVATPMVSDMLTKVTSAVECGRIIPIGRAGTPDDIAGIALFLVSDASSYINGATIFVDGGLHVEQRWDNAIVASEFEDRGS